MLVDQVRTEENMRSYQQGPYKHMIDDFISRRALDAFHLIHTKGDKLRTKMAIPIHRPEKVEECMKK